MVYPDKINFEKMVEPARVMVKSSICGTGYWLGMVLLFSARYHHMVASYLVFSLEPSGVVWTSEGFMMPSSSMWLNSCRATLVRAETGGPVVSIYAV